MHPVATVERRSENSARDQNPRVRAYEPFRVANCAKISKQVKSGRKRLLYNRRIMKPKMGRPSKMGRKEPGQFARVMAILHGYRQAREKGLKHSVAIRETVVLVGVTNPEKPISETEVKRVLAEFQPKNCKDAVTRYAVTVEFSVLQGKEAAQRRHYIRKMAASPGTAIELSGKSF